MARSFSPKEDKQEHRDAKKNRSMGQKEVEQMMRTREMSNEERKQSKKAQKVGKLKTSSREAPGT